MSELVFSSLSNSMHSISRAWMPCLAVRSTLQGGSWMQQPVLDPVAAQHPLTQKGGCELFVAAVCNKVAAAPGMTNLAKGRACHVLGCPRLRVVS